MDVAADSLPAWWAMQVPPRSGNGWLADGPPRPVRRCLGRLGHGLVPGLASGHARRLRAPRPAARGGQLAAAGRGDARPRHALYRLPHSFANREREFVPGRLHDPRLHGVQFSTHPPAALTGGRGDLHLRARDSRQRPRGLAGGGRRQLRGGAHAARHLGRGQSALPLVTRPRNRELDWPSI